MCANPSYIRFGKLNFPAITACETKAYSILVFTCESASLNAPNIKAYFKTTRLWGGVHRGRLQVFFLIEECILMEGQMWGA